MADASRSPGMDQRPSLGALVADIVSELRQLVRGEITLAKAEVKESIRVGVAGGALLAVAAVLLAMFWLLLTWAAVYGLAETELPLWACFLIVGGVYLIAGAVLAFVGLRRLKRARGPERAVAEMQRTKDIVTAISPSSHAATRTLDKHPTTR